MKKWSVFLIFAFILVAAPSFAEADNGKFLPSIKTPFDYTNIYFQIEPARLQLPMFFFSQGAHAMTNVGYGAAFEVGYNWDGWLFGLRWTGAWYGKGETERALINSFSHTNFSVQIAKIIAKPMFDSFPKYLEIVPFVGFGGDIVTADYYRSRRAKDAGLNKIVSFGDVAAFSFNFGVHLDFNFGFDQFIPYLNFDATIFYDRGYEENQRGYTNLTSSGSAFFPSISVGVRTYLFRVKKPAGALPSLAIEARPQPLRVYANRRTIEWTTLFPTVTAFKREPRSWFVQLKSPAGKKVKTWAGQGLVPERLEWSGETDAETAVTESGLYQVEFAVQDVKKTTYTAQTELEVVVIRGEPLLETAAVPHIFTPDADGIDDTTTIRIDAWVPDEAKTWEVQLYDPVGLPFKKFAGNGMPPQSIEWDGKGDSGEKVQSRQVYPYTVTVTDKKDAVLTAKADVEVGLLVEVESPDTIRIVVSNIFFDPDAATFNKITPAQRQSNLETLDSVARQIGKYPGYAVVIEGHANNVTNTQRENIEELIPLSQLRAETIKRELEGRGIEGSRMTPKGEGGNRPLVKWENRAEWWKNRRVEFILQKISKGAN